ncbi:MAG TPA: hypothetical protein ENI42_02080, partial [Thermoplasmatales archaeon]|nr:hypothetical protein [Thermoplasmatales archaeon]
MFPLRMKLGKKSDAVSEVIGTILLLVIAVSA